ncbi:MAG TPA: hypothetical protein VLK27_02935 [Chthoniobacterales bacterium]|nr:hypothetical protein [Chthoniobacterales bacterium]
MASISRLFRARFAGLFLGLACSTLFAGGHCLFAEGPVNKVPQIEYISPDGKFSSLSADNPNARESTASFVDRNTVSCALHEGETTFIIELPKNATSDRFTFLNQNADACGELRIAVSDSALPVDSPKWTEVDGIVPFAHKRLFKLSILGVETKFVRLSFRVANPEERSARISQPFRGSILDQEIDSGLAILREHARELNLAAFSVGPLQATAK